MDERASDIQVVGRVDERGNEILTPDALALVEELQRRFGGRRDELLRRRRVRREEMSRAATADFLPETRECVRRNGPWLRHQPISSIDESRSPDPPNRKWRSTR